MAKTKEEVVEVEVKASGDILATAVAESGAKEGEYVTDLTGAKEVININGTILVKW